MPSSLQIFLTIGVSPIPFAQFPLPMLKRSLASARFWRLSRGLSALTVGIAIYGTLAPRAVQAQGTSTGKGSGLPSTIEQEILRRQQRLNDASAAIQAGDKLVGEKNYGEALAKFQSAVDLLPESPQTATMRQMALNRFADASVLQAKFLAGQGRYEEAERLLDAVLSSAYFPDHRGALTLKQHLQDPDRYNPAMSPKHAENVEKVKALLTLAHGHIDLGDFDAAEAAFNQVLNVDPTNTAAQRGKEQCERMKSDYALAARDHTRMRAIREVDANWETTVPEANFIPKLPNAVLQEAAVGPTSKLSGLIFPRLRVESAGLDEVVQYLVGQARLIDQIEPDESKKGINIIVNRNGLDLARLSPITLDLREVPLREVLNYVAEQSGTRWRLQDGLVVFSSKAGADGQIIQKSYSVPPGFLASAPLGESKSAEGDPFAGAGTTDTSGLKNTLKVTKVSAKEFLESSGVPFPPGTGADYNRAANQIVVRNTEANLELVQGIVDQLATKSPRQALVRVSLLQTTETKLKELGFDWLLGQFNLGSRVFGSGGTYSNQGGPSSPETSFPIVLPKATAAAQSVPVGQFPVTGGLRSAGALRTNSTIDDLLFLNRFQDLQTTRSPGIFALTGAFTDPQFQTVLRALNQSKGVDLSVATSVVVRSGQVATAKSVREMMVPTDFDPPQVPQTATNFSLDPAGAAQPPVTPTTPTTFEKRDVGSLIEVEATISDDGSMVDLVLAPQFVEFDGFINYGNTINSTANGESIELTKNLILQPVFRQIRTQKVNLSVYDGATFSFAGLLQAKETEIEDKVPLLGDLPLIGRLFRSEIHESSKRAVVFFVTVNVIDGAGRRLRETGDDLTRRR